MKKIEIGNKNGINDSFTIENRWPIALPKNPKSVRITRKKIWKATFRKSIQTIRRFNLYHIIQSHSPQIILSNRTLPKISQSVFKERKIAFPKWEDAIRARPAKMRRIIQRAGLSMIKTNQVRSALRKIRSDFGECSLDSLKYLSCAEAEDYLISLPGVSEKVAKCVLMYTMNCRVLPVDVHVYRISHRLGWTVRKRADQCHEELESLVRPEWRFAFHVDCIAHGRSCCKSQFPTCDRCCINKYCEYYRGMR